MESDEDDAPDLVVYQASPKLSKSPPEKQPSVDNDSAKVVPVTIISGFLGAGMYV